MALIIYAHWRKPVKTGTNHQDVNKSMAWIYFIPDVRELSNYKLKIMDQPYWEVDGPSHLP